jgi:hypothetical protein
MTTALAAASAALTMSDHCLASDIPSGLSPFFL